MIPVPSLPTLARTTLKSFPSENAHSSSPEPSLKTWHFLDWFRRSTNFRSLGWTGRSATESPLKSAANASTATVGTVLIESPVPAAVVHDCAQAQQEVLHIVMATLEGAHRIFRESNVPGAVRSDVGDIDAGDMPGHFLVLAAGPVVVVPYLADDDYVVRGFLSTELGGLGTHVPYRQLHLRSPTKDCRCLGERRNRPDEHQPH